jgi:hypothetical protein
MTTDSREWEVESDVSPPPRRGRSRSVKVVDQVEMDPGPIARGRSKRDGLSCPKPMSSKVKARVKVQEDAGESDDLSDRRLAAVRGQTPGPPSWRPSTRRGKLT